MKGGVIPNLQYKLPLSRVLLAPESRDLCFILIIVRPRIQPSPDRRPIPFRPPSFQKFQ